MALKTIRLGVLGLGTVGAGTIKILQDNAASIAAKTGCQFEVVAASARDITKTRDCDLQGVALTTDPFEVVAADVDIVVELIGGYDLPRELALAAIKAGKHFVTANKALIAKHGNELFAAASETNSMVAYEASVAGGIPVIKALREGLAGNEISQLAGIINGTTNFILTEMRDKGRDFADVLAEAQALGYAEADPTFDVGGIDAAHKLVILTSLAYGIPLNFDGAYIEGIESITTTDVNLAGELGYKLKHLGIARKTNAGVEMRVHPALVPQSHLLAKVDGVMNAILVHGNAVGETLYYGPGAGAGPTGSAVVADILDVARQLEVAPESRLPNSGYVTGLTDQSPVLGADDFCCEYYLRIAVADKPGALAKITSVLAEADVSIDAVVQHEPTGDSELATLALITHPVGESVLNSAIAALEQLDIVAGSITRMRVARF